MSDRTTGAVPDPDELASAYLDGELDQPGRAAVEADPALLARVGELAGVRAMVGGATADPPPSLQAAAVAAALEIHDSLWAERPVPAPTPRRWWERLKVAHLGPILAGASIVAVAAVGVVAVVGSDDADTGGEVAITATTAPSTSPAAAGGAPAPFQAGTDPAPFLGTVEEAEDLEPLLRGLPADGATADTETAAEDAVGSATAGSGAADAAGSDTSTAQSATSALPIPVTEPAAGDPEPPASVADAAETVAPAVAAAPPVLRAATPVCAAPEGTTFYGTVDVAGVLAEVFVASSRAVAVSTDGCRVLAEVPLP
jgi:hypothetical protein